MLMYQVTWIRFSRFFIQEICEAWIRVVDKILVGIFSQLRFIKDLTKERNELFVYSKAYLRLNFVPAMTRGELAASCRQRLRSVQLVSTEALNWTLGLYRVQELGRCGGCKKELQIRRQFLDRHTYRTRVWIWFRQGIEPFIQLGRPLNKNSHL